MKEATAPVQKKHFLAGRILAVGSGKGGVGKSITSVNLAICFARVGMRTALCDLDPLSDTAVILDIRKPEEQSLMDGIDRQGELEDYTLQVLPRLDLLFPSSNLKEGESGVLRDLLFGRFARQIGRKYDMIIMDMPAGIGREENLSFLPFVDNLVVVTNPEPTSHVSAGGYIRAALDIHPELNIHLWHNRYRVDPSGRFNTRAVVANYNRFAGEDLMIRPEEAIFHDLAFVPEDPTLNLLKGGLPITVPVLYRLIDALETIHERIIMTAPVPASRINAVTMKLVRYYLLKTGFNSMERLPELFAYLNSFRNGSGVQDETVQKAIAVFTAGPVKDRVRNTLLETAAVFADEAAELLEKDRLFSSGIRTPRKGRPDAAIASFLRTFASSPHYRDRFMRNSAGLVLYYYSLYRLFQSKTVTDLFMKILPVRRENGLFVRDRQRQISFLLEKDEEYHHRYYRFIEKLFPVSLKQLEGIASSVGVRNLILPGKDGRMNRNVYLRLLADIVQDTANSGMGIIQGQRFNRASREMERGARNIRSAMFGDGPS